MAETVSNSKESRVILSSVIPFSIADVKFAWILVLGFGSVNFFCEVLLEPWVQKSKRREKLDQSGPKIYSFSTEIIAIIIVLVLSFQFKQRNIL